MSMLHIVNKSPFERHTLKSCIRHLCEGDSVLLIEDAVVGALLNTEVAAWIAAEQNNASFYVLSEDLAARGLSDKPLVNGMLQVNYADFVNLVVEHAKVQSWL